MKVVVGYDSNTSRLFIIAEHVLMCFVMHLSRLSPLAIVTTLKSMYYCLHFTFGERDL